MKVILLNGSPNNDGCTARALKEVANTLNHDGIETEIINIGNDNIRGCIACLKCREINRCIFDDLVNVVAKKLEEADGIVIGSPVYYAGINGSLKSLLDRLFYSTRFDKTMKLGACVVSSRRAGSTTAYDEIHKYFGITGMPIVTSTYWNEVHGFTKEDVEKDLEGLQTMRNLGHNMAFMLKAINDAKGKYGMPLKERGNFTSFNDGL